MIPLGVLAQRRAAAGGPSGEFIGTHEGSSSTSYTGISLGTPAAGRIVVATLSWRHNATNSRQPTAVTIAGVTATLAVSTGSHRAGAAIWYATVPTGSTGDVAVTWSAATVFVRLGIYTTSGSLTASGFAAVDGVSTTHTVTLDPTSAGAFIVAAAANYAPDTIDLTAGVTEDTDGTYLVHGHGFASGATHDVTAVGTGTFHNRLAAAAFSGA